MYFQSPYFCFSPSLKYPLALQPLYVSSLLFFSPRVSKPISPPLRLYFHSSRSEIQQFLLEIIFLIFLKALFRIYLCPSVWLPLVIFSYFAWCQILFHNHPLEAFEDIIYCYHSYAYIKVISRNWIMGVCRQVEDNNNYFLTYFAYHLWRNDTYKCYSRSIAATVVFFWSNVNGLVSQLDTCFF